MLDKAAKEKENALMHSEVALCQRNEELVFELAQHKSWHREELAKAAEETERRLQEAVLSDVEAFKNSSKFNDHVGDEVEKYWYKGFQDCANMLSLNFE
jgi:hypothetical protein